MTRVRCILVLTTLPVKIRPRMLTRPVKGHFLSVAACLVSYVLQYRNVPLFPMPSLTQSSFSFDLSSGRHCIPMYLPSMAFLGVRKPRPTSLYHLLPPLPTALDLVAPRLWLRKTCGCFWKARSLWTVNSVAMIAVGVQSRCVGRGCLSWWNGSRQCGEVRWLVRRKFASNCVGLA